MYYAAGKLPQNCFMGRNWKVGLVVDHVHFSFHFCIIFADFKLCHATDSNFQNLCSFGGIMRNRAPMLDLNLKTDQNITR